MTALEKITSAMQKQCVSGYRLSKMTGIHNTDIYRILSGERKLFPGWERRIFEALHIEAEGEKGAKNVEK